MASFADRLIALAGIAAGVAADVRGSGVWSPTAGSSLSESVLASNDDTAAPRLMSGVPYVPGMGTLNGNSRMVEYLVRQLEQDAKFRTITNVVDGRLLGPVLRRLRAEHCATSPTSYAHLLFGGVNARLASAADAADS